MLGIVLWEILEQRLPWDELVEGGQFMLLDLLDELSRGRRPAITKSCPASYLELMRRCWATVPSMRPSFNDILIDRAFIP